MTISNTTVADSISDNLSAFTTRLQNILDSTIQVRSEFFPDTHHGLPTPPSSPSLHPKKQRKDLAHATQSIRDLSRTVHGMADRSDRRFMQLTSGTETEERDPPRHNQQVDEYPRTGVNKSVQDVGLRISSVLTSLGNMRRDMDKRLACLSEPAAFNATKRKHRNKSVHNNMQGNFVAHWDDWWAFGTLAIWRVREDESKLDEEDDYQLVEDEIEDAEGYNDWCRQDELAMDELVSMTESMLKLE